MFVLGRNAGVHWGDDFIFGIPDDKAVDLEQLMREVFKVKICERIGPGFLTSVKFLHRKLGWNAEGFSWTHDPKHTLAMVDGFGFNGKKQLRSNSSKRSGKSLQHLDRKRQVKVCVMVPTVLMNKKLNSTAHWLAQHCNVGQDRPETQYATKEAARFVSGPTRAAKCMLKRLCNCYSEAPVLSWSFPYQEMPSEIRAVTDANWAGELDGLRSTSCGWIYFGDPSAGDVFIDAADCGAVNCREWVHLDHEGCSSRSGGPQCYGEIWDDVQSGV